MFPHLESHIDVTKRLNAYTHIFFVRCSTDLQIRVQNEFVLFLNQNIILLVKLLFNALKAVETLVTVNVYELPEGEGIDRLLAASVMFIVA